MPFVWQAWHTGLAVGSVMALALVAAQPAPDDAITVTTLTLTTAIFAATSHAAGRSALLASLVGGLALGVLSSVDFYFHEVENMFTAVAATLGTLLMCGLIIGAFAEFVVFVHGALHGRKARE